MCLTWALLLLGGPMATFAVAAKEPEIFVPVRVDLGIWTGVVFLILSFVLRKYAWGPLLDVLKKREQNIHAAIDDAQRARDEAQRMRDQLKAELDKAGDKVRDILEEGRRTAQRTADEMLAKTRSEIQNERDRLRREIETARDQAIQELFGQAAQLATLISSKALRRQLSENDHRVLVDEAIQELGQANVGLTDRLH